MNARRRPTGLAAAVAAGLLLGGCGGDDDHDHDESASGQSADAAESDFGHIHGLGVADDVLYVATHYGLFTVAEDQATEVSDDDHDFMGFTVVDTDSFLASGHPNSRTDLPANLGLLESTDGGQTWDEVSLMGEVDFHALDAKHGVVYGFDSATAELMRSDDHEDWERLGQLAMADVAISPEDAESVIVTTEDGPALSADGGAQFDVLDDAPIIMLIDWPQPDQLVGVGPDGAVHRSADGGETWEAGADLDERPQAMTVAPDGEVYVALGQSIVVSTDGGQTFSEFYTW
ncbi:F510_1955 family glycosylhydrolase [Phytoactinopolyspora mesophila]|uniref:F510_1955 family glycosylhydrolase n=1 Tax=Phytoactinopolyspora mesophila TaxID=2650750 RepID=UPI001C9E5F39|nr:hypothetical protein [Phytoactinopolyspora mesophila]